MLGLASAIEKNFEIRHVNNPYRYVQAKKKNTMDIYFEIADSGNLVRLEPLELIKYNSELDWDKNWIKTNVIIRGGKFIGQYNGEFMSIDFERLKQELVGLYDNLKGELIFKDLEGYLDLKIKGDGFGHFDVNVIACDQPGIYGSILTFKMTFDQTLIKDMTSQLDRITKQFPIKGKFNIKNK